MRRVWIDCDPGIDDAVAIALLAKQKAWQIAAISAVAGNTSLAIVSQNLKSIVRQIDLQLPVYQGFDKQNSYMISQHADVKSQGSFELAARPEGEADLFALHPGNEATGSLDSLLQVLATSQEPLTILALGPLTNIAYVMEQAPELIHQIEEIVLMGGCLGPGNYGPGVEFNFGFDPQATKKVLALDCLKTVIPLEIGKKLTFNLTDLNTWPVWTGIQVLIQPLLEEIHGGQMPSKIKLFDLLAAYYLVEPSAFDLTALRLTSSPQGAMLYDKQAGSFIQWAQAVDSDLIFDMMRK